MRENIKLSLQGIWSHKMRSMLTMLGIIIGIASIIAIVSTITGNSEMIKESLIGSNNNVVTVIFSGVNRHTICSGTAIRKAFCPWMTILRKIWKLLIQ